jgi:hypothetical protein
MNKQFKLTIKEISLRGNQQKKSMIMGAKRKILGYKIGSIVKLGDIEEGITCLCRVIGHNEEGTVTLVEYINGDKDKLVDYGIGSDDWLDREGVLYIETETPGIFDHLGKEISPNLNKHGYVYYWAAKVEMEKVADSCNIKLKIKLPKADE